MPPLERNIQSAILKWLKCRKEIGFVRKVSDLWSSGMPDIMFILRASGRACFIEVKAPGGALSELQQATITALSNSNCPVFVAYSLEEAKSFVGKLENNHA